MRDNNTAVVVDIDGIIFDSTERFKRATREDGSIDWETAFNTDLVQLDTLIEGADKAVEQLRLRYTLYYLTSRPAHMEMATRQRLAECRMQDFGLMCKPLEKKYTKTVRWKADEIAELAKKFNKVIFIDDEEANRLEVMRLALGNVDCYASLAQALEAIGDEDDKEA